VTHLKPVLVALVLVGAVGLLVTGVLIFRGFRATSTPSPLEASLARSVRNLAIPVKDRARKNPLEPNSEATEQGREYFLAHCSNCHGIDGGGKTQMGTNLYPRVPDLRSAKTQSLSDGELHYIIENGVQLTGMPAWGNAHSDATGDVWKLVLFIRTLRSLTPQEIAEAKTLADHGTYIGSQACAKCHSEIYDRWKKTPMANVVRDPRTHPEALAANLATNNVHKFTLDQVAFVYGSIWKQRYFTKIGDDYFPLPVQWNIGKHTWAPYMVPAGGDWWASKYPPDNMQRPTGPLCDGCHSVGYDIRTKQVAEWNVGCERCHGPGSEHAAHPLRSNILSPAQLASTAESDVCIQCHSQGQPLSNPIKGKYYDWAVGYDVSRRLPDFWRLEDCTLGQTTFYYFPDCTAHKNRMQGNDFAQSVMYHHGVTCSSCHDAHGTANYAQLRKPAAEICLDCHGPTSPNGPHTASIEEHTHHKADSRGSQCVSCHMPQIETEGVPGALVHAHTFRFISPAMTDKYKIPNPCNSCHQEKSTSWAQEAISHWSNEPPYLRSF